MIIIADLAGFGKLVRPTVAALSVTKRPEQQHQYSRDHTQGPRDSFESNRQTDAKDRKLMRKQKHHLVEIGVRRTREKSGHGIHSNSYKKRGQDR